MARITRFYIGLLAPAVALAIAVPAAQAFTLDKAGNTNADGTAKYADPDSKYEAPADRNGTSFQFGGGTVTVGPQRSFDSDFNSGKQRMLTPLGRPGDDR